MFSLAVMNLKGGATKSSTAVHCAVEGLKRGKRVLLIDTDAPQHSAFVWNSLRNAALEEAALKKAAPIGNADKLHVVTSTISKLKSEIEKARAEGYDLVIVDTAPRLGPEAVDIAKTVDRVLVPVKPEPFDLAAVQQTLDIVREHGIDAKVFLSACPPKGEEIEETLEVLQASGVPIMDVRIGDRKAFKRAIKYGQAVSEYQPRGIAAKEMKALMDQVLA